MNRIRTNASVAGIPLILLTRANAKTPAPISLKLATDTNPVKVGTEVKVTITVKNEGQEAIMIADGTSEHIYKVDVRDNLGNPVPEKKHLRIFSIGGMTLYPGRSHTDEIVLSNMYDLSRPGTYFVMVGRNPKVEPESGTENLRSNLLVINVTI